MAEQTNLKFFITHSWRDNAFAQRLANDLRARGFGGFLDIYSVKAGDDIPREINRGLEECDIYIPILSFESLKSKWCEREINAALMLSAEPERNGRPHILPVLAEDCRSALPPLLKSRRYVNFAGRYKAALDETLEGIQDLRFEIEHETQAKIVQIQRGEKASTDVWLPKQVTKIGPIPLLPQGILIVAGTILVCVFGILFNISSLMGTANPTVTLVSASPSVTSTPTRVSTNIPAPTSTHTATPVFTPTPKPMPELYSWVQRNPSPFPLNGGNYGLAYDSRRNVYVVFGGSPVWDTYVPETWEWDGREWRNRRLSTSPSARSNHDMSFDSRRGVIVLFGGHQRGGNLNDTWEYDGSAWTQRQINAPPPPLERSCSAFDGKRGVLVLFGGRDFSKGIVYGDTWTYDGISWIKQSPLKSPSARGNCAMAYDSNRASIVLFGGEGGGSGLDDTWEWDGSNWAERSLAIRPPARAGHSLVYHTGLGMVLAFGGDKGSCSVLYEDTWAWDGYTASWQRLPTNSPGTHSVIMSAYSPQMDSVLLFGGWAGGSTICRIISETWEYVRTYQR